jgi:hypothetical protein
MEQNQVEKPCFLCGQRAMCRDTDYGNRKSYQCSAGDCGDYEISAAALRRLENSISHREQLKHFVHDHQETEKFVEIIVGADNQVVVKAVQRNSSRRT